MRRSRRARTVRRPLATRPSPTRARPPTAAPVRGREFGRLSVSPSTWVAGAVVVVAVTPAVSSGDPAAVPATSVPAAAPAAGAGPVDATDSGPPVVEAWAEAGQSLASSVSTPQPVRPVMNGETVTAGGAVVVVVVVVDVEVVVEVLGGGVADPPLSPLSPCGLRPHQPLLSSSRSASLPQPLLPSRSASRPPVQPGLSAPPLLMPSGSECDRPCV